MIKEGKNFKNRLGNIKKFYIFMIMITLISCIFFPIELSDHNDEYTLTINIVGDGRVDMNPNQATYSYGTVVWLTAIPGDNWVFEYWGGDFSGMTNPQSIIMDSNKLVIANFHEQMEIIMGGGGSDIKEENNTEPSGSNVNTIPVVHIPPVADANGPYDGIINEEIIFDGSLSYGLEGEITSWYWDFGDGAYDYGEVVKHTYTAAKTYAVILTVMDSNYQTDKDKTIITIIQPNRPPLEPEILGPLNCTNENTYSYSFISTDLDGDDVKYIIDWGDGSVYETGLLPSGIYFSVLHKWIKPGEYKIIVTASDEQYSSNSEKNVVINENIMVDNIVIIILGIVSISALVIAMIYIRKVKKNTK